MSENLAKPKVGMIVRKKRSGSLYQIHTVEAAQVYIRPYWPSRNSRSTWKSIDRLWCDYYQVDYTSVISEEVERLK